MTVSAFGVEDGRIAKADKRHTSAAESAVAGGTVGTVAGAVAASPARARGRWAGAEAARLRSLSKPGPVEESHAVRAARGEDIAEAAGKAKSLRRIANKRVAAGAAIGAAYAGSTRAIHNKLSKSAFDVEDDRISKAACDKRKKQ